MWSPRQPLGSMVLVLLPKIRGGSIHQAQKERGGHFGEFGLVFAEILLLCFAQQEDCSGCSCACCRRQEGAEPSPALAEVSSAVGTYTPTQHQVNANLRER